MRIATKKNISTLKQTFKIKSYEFNECPVLILLMFGQGFCVG